MAFIDGISNISKTEAMSGLLTTRQNVKVVDTIGQPGGGFEYIGVSLNLFSGDEYSLELATLTSDYPGYWEFGLNVLPDGFPSESTVGYLDIGFWVNGVKELGGLQFTDRLFIPANSEVVFKADASSVPSGQGAYPVITGYTYKLSF